MNPPRMTTENALKFCEACNWAYEVWATHRALFEENLNDELNIRKSPSFFKRLSIITQEYTLLQIAKLHDPAISQRKFFNLTIDFIVSCGDGRQSKELKAIAKNLKNFGDQLLEARKKLLAHNDLNTIEQEATLGKFRKGQDEEYFQTLQKFVNEVHNTWIGGPYIFNDLAKADAEEFLSLLERCHFKGGQQKAIFEN